MIRKIRNKAKAFWKHGKHKNLYEINILNNMKKIIRSTDMVDSIKTLFAKKVVNDKAT